MPKGKISSVYVAIVVDEKEGEGIFTINDQSVIFQSRDNAEKACPLIKQACDATGKNIKMCRFDLFASDLMAGNSK